MKLVVQNGWRLPCKISSRRAWIHFGGMVCCAYITKREICDITQDIVTRGLFENSRFRYHAVGLAELRCPWYCFCGMVVDKNDATAGSNAGLGFAV